MLKKLKECYKSQEDMALMWAFMFFCKFFCKNRVKRFLTGEKKYSMGYILKPQLCRMCPEFNPKAPAVYKSIGRWDT